MSLPTARDLQPVDPILTNMLIAYMQSESRFVADRVFPQLPVDKDSGTYFIFDKKYWFLDNAAARAYGGNFAFGDFGVSSGTFTTTQYALARAIADEERANSQLPMDLETASVRWLGMQHMIRRERAWAAGFMKTTVWGTDASISAKWSDYTLSDPVGDVRTGKRTISQATGYTPNLMLIGEIVEDRLVNHPDLLDRIKFVQQATMGNIRNALAALFGVDVLLVGAAVYNSANEGQTAVMAPIIDDDCLLTYSTPTPGIMEPSCGYTFTWAAGGGGGTIYPPYRDNGRKSDVITSNQQFAHEVTASDLGYFIADCVD